MRREGVRVGKYVCTEHGVCKVRHVGDEINGRDFSPACGAGSLFGSLCVFLS